jgi:hypothetical protein
MCHRIGHRNQVGFRAKADLASGPAANDLERLTLSGHGLEVFSVFPSAVIYLKSIVAEFDLDCRPNH